MPKKKKNERAQDIAQPEQAVTLIPDEERGQAPVDDVPAVAAPEVAEESAAPVAVPSEEEGAPVDGVIRIGETAEGVKKLNGFDRFWIKVWSYIVSAFNAMARGINFVIEKIFKKRVPDRYIIAVLATIVVILLMLLVTAPFKITVNDVEEMQLYNSGLTPVQQRVGTDPVSGYPVYKWGYANESGRIVIDCRFDNVTEFKHGVAFVNVVEENEEGIIEDYWYLIDDGGDRRGEIRIVADTSGAIPVGEFGDEVKLAPVYIGGKYGFMNTRGDMQISADLRRGRDVRRRLRTGAKGRQRVFHRSQRQGACRSGFRTLSAGQGFLRRLRGGQEEQSVVVHRHARRRTHERRHTIGVRQGHRFHDGVCSCQERHYAFGDRPKGQLRDLRLSIQRSQSGGKVRHFVVVRRADIDASGAKERRFSMQR